MILQYLLACLCFNQVSSAIRGVDPANTSLYQGQQFRCLDGTQSFPMNHVNDDYCDCNDGSDEPGTAACYNGFFYCLNKGFKGMFVASSRIDDGICDCCDGSDEISGKCVNNCADLGAHLLIESRRIRREQAMGYQQRMGYSTDGKAAKLKRVEDMKVLGAEEDKMRMEMEIRKSYMEEVEKPAIAAKVAAKAILDAEVAARDDKLNEEYRIAAEMEFGQIDANSDGEITVEELLEYGSSEDAVLPYEDIKLITDSEEIETATLLQSIQDKLKEIGEEQKKSEEQKAAKEKRRAKKPQLDLPPPVDEEQPEEDEEEELWGEDGKKIEKNIPDIEEEFEEEFEEDEEYDQPSPVTNTITYDAETQKLIDIYKEADDIYKSAKSSYDGAKRQIDDLRKIDNFNFGSDEEFYALYGQCYHYSDDNYKYKLCPFDKSEQDGTSIGKWEGWESDPDGANRFNKMKYSKGQGCWNGPARSTVVEIVCGSENELMSASEPAKCEYHFKFKTPAACDKVQDESEIHDEL